VEALALVIGTAIATIISQGENFYESVDMKVGRNPEKILMYKELLMGLFTLDPRGGHFLQGDVEQSVEKAVTDASLMDGFGRLAAAAGRSIDEMRNMIAYKIRVMCSHAREMASNCDDASPLKDLYDMVCSPGLGGQWPIQRASASTSIFPNLQKTADRDDGIGGRGGI
jgi:hypothetical protein